MLFPIGGRKLAQKVKFYKYIVKEFFQKFYKGIKKKICIEKTKLLIQGFKIWGHLETSELKELLFKTFGNFIC